jgi:hypothetical protein
MTEEVIIIPLNITRGIYMHNCFSVGSGARVKFIRHQKLWNPITGVALCFWAVLSALSVLAVRYPLAMLPLLYMQLFYKTFCLIAMYIPLCAIDRISGLLVKSRGMQ